MRHFSFLLTLLLLSAVAKAEPFKLANVVCFVKFADQKDNKWEEDFSYYEKMFNATGEGVNSVRNYFNDMSYGRFDWESTLILTEYVDSHPRSYFCERSEDNPGGYTSLDYLLDTRTRTLVKDMCSYLSDVIPDDVVLDANGDGTVDNIVLIINGNSERGASNMLWPANNTAPAARLKGLNVKNYLKVFDGANGYKTLVPQKLNTGVLCHEMMHTLNAYDLYTSSSSPKIEPVNVWDLMSDNQKIPQGLTAYMRHRYGANYGKWIEDSELPILTESGVYELAPLSAMDSDAKGYRIVPDPKSDEYFMLEYRDREDIWDMSLPASGLLVYRVNPKINGNLGKNCEVYIFRPDGAVDKAGKVNRAPLGPNTGRLSFGGEEDTDYPFYQDGTRAPFFITEVAKTGDKISFRYNAGLPDDTGVDEIFDNPEDAPKTIYNLQGIRLDHIPGPGIYIINGKKVKI